jgi:hypothetical protein
MAPPLPKPLREKSAAQLGSDATEDCIDLASEQSQRCDSHNGDERYDQRVLGKTLSLFVAKSFHEACHIKSSVVVG